ncbi:hypothetical protein EAI30_07560 [Romboutsia ilealis]|uniref:Mor transcription activator domain-containing protein n=1 Tax=Romboutsia faecis TaxID=2764597 RepID=A0ABR7JKE6_9FIRM|nr:Mor transcription activator family protein [Romboutsia faecis]MBC5995285.1 hypothetical protein [Romboutsia faecis]MRN24470.1 hypothetical protein [Romboutsia ilealis]
MSDTMLDKAMLEDVPENFKELAQILGMDAFKNLLLNYGGTKIYVPTSKTISIAVRNKMLKKNFDGNYQKASFTYRITENQVRRIISNKSK